MLDRINFLNAEMYSCYMLRSYQDLLPNHTYSVRMYKYVMKADEYKIPEFILDTKRYSWLNLSEM